MNNQIRLTTHVRQLHAEERNTLNNTMLSTATLEKAHINQTGRFLKWDFTRGLRDESNKDLFISNGTVSTQNGALKMSNGCVLEYPLNRFFPKRNTMVLVRYTDNASQGSLTIDLYGLYLTFGYNQVLSKYVMNMSAIYEDGTNQVFDGVDDFDMNPNYNGHNAENEIAFVVDNDVYGELSVFLNGVKIKSQALLDATKNINIDTTRHLLISHSHVNADLFKLNELSLYDVIPNEEGGLDYITQPILVISDNLYWALNHQNLKEALSNYTFNVHSDKGSLNNIQTLDNFLELRNGASVQTNINQFFTPYSFSVMFDYKTANGNNKLIDQLYVSTHSSLAGGEGSMRPGFVIHLNNKHIIVTLKNSTGDLWMDGWINITEHDLTQFHRYCIVYDHKLDFNSNPALRTKLYFYFDGILLDTKTYNTDNPVTREAGLFWLETQNLYLNQQYDKSINSTCCFDNVRVWNRAIEPSEISAVIPTPVSLRTYEQFINLNNYKLMFRCDATDPSCYTLNPSVNTEVDALFEVSGHLRTSLQATRLGRAPLTDNTTYDLNGQRFFTNKMTYETLTGTTKKGFRGGAWWGRKNYNPATGKLAYTDTYNNGYGDILKYNYDTAPTAIENNKFTTVAVFERGSTTGWGAWASMYTYYRANGSRGLWAGNANGTLKAGGASVLSATGATSYGTNNLIVLVNRHEYISGTYDYHTNLKIVKMWDGTTLCDYDASENTDTSPHTELRNNTGGFLAIGNDEMSNDVNPPVDVRWGEFLMYNEWLSDTDVDSLIEILRAKWNF